MSNTAEVLRQCRSLPGVTVTEKESYTEMQLSSSQGHGCMRFVPLFPGITLALISVSAPSWPAPLLGNGAPEAKGPLIVNYCLRGRCELVLNDSRSVFLTSGHISLTEKFACGEYIYPGSVYEGIELFIDPDDMEPPLLRDHFGIRIPTLRRLYCLEGETFIAKLPLPEELTDRLQGLSITEEPVRTISMKTGVIDLLALLQYRHPAPEAKRLTYYTKPQVEMAKQIEAIISGDLSQPHTAREFAARFSVSESSIKNYFRGVYGQSILQAPHTGVCCTQWSCSPPPPCRSLRSPAASAMRIKANSPLHSGKAAASRRVSSAKANKLLHGAT